MYGFHDSNLRQMNITIPYSRITSYVNPYLHVVLDSIEHEIKTKKVITSLQPLLLDTGFNLISGEAEISLDSASEKVLHWEPI